MQETFQVKEKVSQRKEKKERRCLGKMSTMRKLNRDKKKKTRPTPTIMCKSSLVETHIIIDLFTFLFKVFLFFSF